MTTAGLTIREVVARTGVEAATLRMWEVRHGFPSPERLPSGHRRYSERDVTQIAEVVREREAGLELHAAIARARMPRPEPSRAAAEGSIHAGLRRQRPGLAPHLLPKRVLIAISHAIEDEGGACAARAMLFGSFQREHFYRFAEPRWRDLASSARCAIVLADFEALREPPGAPVEVPIDCSEPLGREWSVIWDAPQFAAMLSAWECPGQDDVPDAERTFESIWSIEPELVRDAARVACSIASRSAPHVTERVAGALAEHAPTTTGSDTSTLANLTNRIVAYIGGSRSRPAPPPSAAE